MWNVHHISKSTTSPRIDLRRHENADARETRPECHIKRLDAWSPFTSFQEPLDTIIIDRRFTKSLSRTCPRDDIG